MIVGYIVIGTVVGLCAAGVSLATGASFWWAFITYVVVGNATIALAAIVSARHRGSSAARSDVADGEYLGNRNLNPVKVRHPLMRPSRRADAFHRKSPQAVPMRSNTVRK